MSKPLITIIIPTYNRADLVPRAINSALNQTFKDFEIIIVDDGSTDNTKDVIKKYLENNNKIKYIFQKNSGAVASPRNTAIKLARGKYIALLDDDDEWLPSKLEKQIKLFNNNIGIVGSGCYFVYDNNYLKKKTYEIKGLNNNNHLHKILKDRFIVSSSSVIIPKYIFDKVGLFDEKCRVTEDWDLYIRILKHYKFSYINEPLFFYHIHDINISGNISANKFINDHKRTLIKHKEEWDNNLKAKSKLLRNIGSYFMVLNNTKEARNYFWQSIKIDPFYIRNYINFTLSLISLKIYNKIRNIKKN